MRYIIIYILLCLLMLYLMQPIYCLVWWFNHVFTLRNIIPQSSLLFQWFHVISEWPQIVLFGFQSACGILCRLSLWTCVSKFWLIHLPTILRGWFAALATGRCSLIWMMFCFLDDVLLIDDLPIWRLLKSHIFRCNGCIDLCDWLIN